MSRISALPLAVATVTTALAGLLAGPAPAQAAPAPGAPGALVALTASAAPRVPPGATRLAAVPASSEVTLDVTLKVRDQAGLNTLLAGLANRNSPLFHHFLAPGQFGAAFGPAPAQVTAVEDALRSMGLSPGPVSADRLSIPVTATAAVIDHALHAGLVRYRLSGDRVAYANSAAPQLPATVASLVTGVVGLNNLYPQQSQALRPAAPAASGPVRAQATAATAAGPQACASAVADAAGYRALTAGALAAHYGMTPLYALGDLGAGQRIALIEFEPNLPSDISAYESCYGIRTAVNYVKVDGGAGAGAGSGEAALDIEDAAGLAPDAAIDVYQAPNNSTGSYDEYQQIITADTDKVISTSWGICEDYSSTAVMDSAETLYEQAAAQGQTVLAAAGDSGSAGCYRSGGPDASAVDVQTPASSPYVVGVGGTEIRPAGPDVAWNESATGYGAGSGGISAVWCMPAYQDQTAIPGLVNADSQTSPACPAATGSYWRQVPDVSADADPDSGYVVDFDGSWTAIAGTSAAAPLWAAVAALVNASPFCADYGSGTPGALPQGLYEAAAEYHGYIYSGSSLQAPEVLGDVTEGGNDYTPSGYTGGLFPAGKGYDEASGLGVPLLTGLAGSAKPSMYYPGLAALMCGIYRTKLTSTAVTGITPAAGAAGHAVTVTVHGSGFLPVAGADLATVGSTEIPADCTSSTQCTVALPALAARTVDIQVSAEDDPASPLSTASRYEYLPAPDVSALSPATGPGKGGTKVTVHGTGFTAVTAVHFGTKAAAGVKVVSATEITVTAPAGKDTVHVTVTAAGGTSGATSSASDFKYS